MKQKIEKMRQILDDIETERFKLHVYQTIKEAFPSCNTDLIKRSSDEIERLQKAFNDEVRRLTAIEL